MATGRLTVGEGGTEATDAVRARADATAPELEPDPQAVPGAFAGHF